jgi:hypothetical protein
MDNVQTGEFTFEKKLIWSVNYGINDDFMIQYDPKYGFAIPSGNEASWNGVEAQNKACNKFDADDLARKIGLETEISEIAKSVYDFYGDDEAQAFIIETFGS